MQNKLSIMDACTVLEIPLSAWNVRQSRSADEAKSKLIKFKELVKAQKRILSKKYHPDKNDGDDTKIKEINNIIDILMKVEIILPPPPRQTIVHFTSHNWSSTTTSSTTFYTRNC